MNFRSKLILRSYPLLACAALLLSGGCATVEPGRTAYGGSYADSRVDSRTESARAATRLDQLEANVRRLQVQVDGLSESQQHVVAQADARLSQARQESQGLQTELDALKRELAASQADQRQIRAAVDELPAKISKAVAAAQPRTPAPQPARPRASGASVGVEHPVLPGQTLSEIARAYGVSMDAIVRENNLKDAGSIRAGQKLFIPRQ